MSNKTISINPSLFSVSGTKTKKNREKKFKPASVPLISPNILKNKLLKRIKEHKQKETENLDNNKKNLNTKESISQENELLKFNDEFSESINYLQTLSKQKRSDEEKKNNLHKRREELERKTVRNYHLHNNTPIIPVGIGVDLPEELIQPVIQSNYIQTEPLKLHEDVPYGILKGGIKPSYREWSKTQRNNIVTNPNASLIIEGRNLTSQNSARENRLNLLKQKIKNKNEEIKTESIPANKVDDTEILIKKPIINEKNIISVQEVFNKPSNQQEIIDKNYNGKIIGTKHITKKTIKRKYTLGRSQIKKTVSVLIKDRGTRKQILSAQKDLKRRNINEIKTYLRDHNLIKIGSNAPNDVLRKIYESAMLAGEITNSNTDTLFHNFSKDDKSL